MVNSILFLVHRRLPARLPFRVRSVAAESMSRGTHIRLDRVPRFQPGLAGNSRGMSRANPWYCSTVIRDRPWRRTWRGWRGALDTPPAKPVLYGSLAP